MFVINLVNREGDLLPELTCRGVGQPYLVDFQLRVLPHKNPDGSVPDDEQAATDLKFRCSNVKIKLKCIAYKYFCFLLMI